MSYTIFTMRPVTEKVGEIRTNGELYATDGKLMGSISVQGRIRDTKGVLLGIVSRDGKFSSDIFDTKKFQASRKGHILQNGSPIGSVKQNDRGIPEKFAQWAACAFFFYGSYPSGDQKKELKEEAKAISEDELSPIQTQPIPDFDQSLIQTQRLPMLDYVDESETTEEIEEAYSEPIEANKPSAEEPEVDQLIDDPLDKTAPLPDLESLENYASMRMAAFMQKKMREKEEI